MIIRPDKLSHKVAAVLLWMGYICDEMIFFWNLRDVFPAWFS